MTDTKFIFVEKRTDMSMGLEFLVHKDIVNAVLGCRPVSSRLISILPRAAPFNIIIIQVYSPTPGHDVGWLFWA